MKPDTSPLDVDTADKLLEVITRSARDMFDTYIQLNHIGFVERFIDNVRGKIVYVPSVGWHIYRNQVWELDTQDDVLALSACIAHSIQFDHADRVLQVNEREYTAALAGASDLRTRRSVIELAGADPRMKTHVGKLNTDPELLAVTNGTLNLRTEALREGRPSDFITQRANVAYDPSARCPRFDALLEHAFHGDREMIDYVWRVLGYCLTGYTHEQSFFFLWGVAGSSKSTIAEVMLALLGSYAATLHENVLTGGDNQHPTWVVDLLGKRLVVKDELDQRRRINTTRLNALTGGKLPQRGRRMHGDFFDIPITAKIMITTNHRPPLGNVHDGVWRRIQPWHFTVALDKNDRIKDYASLLVAEEGSGILNGCLRGLHSYLNVGLLVPRSVESDVDSYRDADDDEMSFITDTFIVTNSRTDWIANEDVHLAYGNWCDNNGVSAAQRLPGQQVLKLLESTGAQREKPRKARRSAGSMSPDTKNMRGFSGVTFAASATWRHEWVPVGRS